MSTGKWNLLTSSRENGFIHMSSPLEFMSQMWKRLLIVVSFWKRPADGLIWSCCWAPREPKRTLASAVAAGDPRPEGHGPTARVSQRSRCPPERVEGRRSARLAPRALRSSTRHAARHTAAVPSVTPRDKVSRDALWTQCRRQGHVRSARRKRIGGDALRTTDSAGRLAG